MQNIGHFFHAWLVFVTPLIWLGYKPSFKKQALFTILYGLGIVFFRKIYDFLPVPFGTHTILLVLLSIVLFTILIKEMNLVKSILTTLIIFSAILINDAIIVIPAMKYFNIDITGLEKPKEIQTYITMYMLSNFSLIVPYVGKLLKTRFKKQSYSL